MSKANSGKGKGVSEPSAQKSGNNDQAAKKGNAKPANVGEARGQATGGQRGGRGGGASRGGQQQSQPQQQGQRAGGRGGNDQKGAAAKQPDYLSKYPRLELEKENKQLDDFTAKIDAAYSELEEIRRRIDVIQEERKAIQDQELESRDNRSEHSMARKKLIDERAALRSTFDKEINARRRKLEELNKQKRQLPISKDIKDSKKVVALNLEHLEARERAVEIQIKRSISTGQDRASSKELGVIAAQRRQVKEWAKFAEEAEAPVNPALDARLKELDEELKKLNEGEREVKSDVNRLKDALQAKGDELGAAKFERSAIAQRIEKFKKDRDAVYAVIREKRKEHNNKIKELQKADREKKAQLEKEKRIKLKKEQRNKALQELSQAYKDELALCDRLTAALVNRQSKQKTVAKEGAEGESVEEKEAEKEEVEEGEEGEEGNDNEEHEDEEKDETTAAEEEEGTEAAPKAPKKKRAFQFTMATHIDFELLSVQPPTSLDEIPAALDSISRKKAFYERLAADKLEQRKKLEAQYAAELQALESPPKKAENGSAAAGGANKKAAGAGAAKKPASAAKKPAAEEAEEKEEEHQDNAKTSAANEEDDVAAADASGDADAAAEEDGDE